jgi:hypothetical protein
MAEQTKPFDPMEEILEFLLSRPTPEQIINRRASDAAQARLDYLFDGHRHNQLTDAERAELEATIQLDEMIANLKARAKLKLLETA